jgi:hypothetical protein
MNPEEAGQSRASAAPDEVLRGGFEYRPRTTADATTSGGRMRDPKTLRGWVGLATALVLVSGSLDFFQGLIAIVRGHYYHFDPNEVLVIDLTAWGWVMLSWGSVVALSGLGLLLRSELARQWVILVCALGIILELGFAGSGQFTLWALTLIALYALVMYALFVHWDDASAPASASD